MKRSHPSCQRYSNDDWDHDPVFRSQAIAAGRVLLLHRSKRPKIISKNAKTSVQSPGLHRVGSHNDFPGLLHDPSFQLSTQGLMLIWQSFATSQAIRPVTANINPEHSIKLECQRVSLRPNMSEQKEKNSPEPRCTGSNKTITGDRCKDVEQLHTGNPSFVGNSNKEETRIHGKLGGTLKALQCQTV